jgi:protein-S-isoprenylcysteine O-methyltransferase Ste14
MANPSSTAIWGATPAASQPREGWLVRRRVTLTIVLMATVAALELLVGAPRDLLRGSVPGTLAAVAAIVTGLLLRSWAAGTIRKWERLAITGPYAFVRHPLYLGSILLTLGFCGLMRSPLLCLLVLSPLAGSYWLAIRREEAVLARSYSGWSAYAHRVGRFLPRQLAWPRVQGWSAAQWLRNREYCAWLGSAIVAGLLFSRSS